MHNKWKEEREFQNNVIQMQRDQSKAKIKFASVVVLFLVLAVLSVAFGVSIAAMFGDAFMNGPN